MATRTLTQYIDDLDGKELEPDEVSTIQISYSGVDYQLDVSPANAKKIESKITPIIANARRVGGKKKTTFTKVAATGGANSQAIRDWAGNNGFEVSPRGRIPINVIEAFNKVH